MTEERLKDILYPLAFKSAGKVNTKDALQAMKQAVNEAIQECADRTLGPEQLLVRRRILNLKVK